MANVPWFYHDFSPPLGADTAQFSLSGTEVKHIIGARRLSIGDILVLMNGRGDLAHCKLLTADKRRSTALVNVERFESIDKPEKNIQLACAIAKLDKLSTMFDMACQLGITHFSPIDFEFSVHKVNEKQQAKLSRISIEAAKQSQQAWLASIEAAQSFVAFMQSGYFSQANTLILIADQRGQSLQSVAPSIQSAQQIILLVGPEGGFSESERQQIDHALIHHTNTHQLALAKPILRIETAAIAGLSAVMQHTIKQK